MNEQKPMPKHLADVTMLNVHSIFYTIQGEGPFAGRTSVFVRLYGCNLQCPNCDTDYTSKKAVMSPASIIEEIRTYGPFLKSRLFGQKPIVVITGGEPLRQNIGELCKKLLAANYTVQIETNGVYCPDDLPYEKPNFHIVCSPKTHLVHPDLVPYVSAWKYVGSAKSLVGVVDGLPAKALDHPMGKSKVLFRPPLNNTAPIYLSPEDSQGSIEPEYVVSTNTENINAVVKSCLAYGYTLNLQIHKLIGVA